MNRQQFISYIKSPSNLNADSTLALEDLVREYPYCQTADILYTLNLFKENSFKYNDQLKLAAAYAADRRIFKNLLNKLHQKKEVTAEVKFVAEEAVSKSTNEFEEAGMQELIHELKNILKNKQPGDGVKIDSLEQIATKLTKQSGIQPKVVSDVRPDIKDYNFGRLDETHTESNKLEKNKALIEKFIAEEPKISPPSKIEFFDPVDYAKHSLEDHDDIVSETLAETFLKQGNATKAIKIYQKLCFVFPEKSSFFAARIEKIKKDQIN